MANLRTIEQGNFSGKTVLVRVDFNVPLSGDVVGDDTRIMAALPTINYLKEQGAKIVLMSHLGRPNGQGFQPEFSLAPVAKHLASVIGEDVVFCPETIGENAQALASGLNPGKIMLLENLRFDAREEQCDKEFSSELAAIADVFVSDAFGCAHRSHASTVGVCEFLPSYAGFLLKGEVETLTSMLDNPKRPFVSILGGSKVSDKIQIIDALIDKCDTIIIGGGMCFTFFMAQGYDVGTSLKEEDWVDRARETLAKAKEAGVQFLLPVDVVVADKFANDANIKLVKSDEIPHDMMGLDIGPDTAKLYSDAIKGAKSVFWNGPMGVFEMTSFEKGTKEVAKSVAENVQADTIIGGGDSVAAVNKFNLADKMTFISTGGGASMKLVQGDTLPGVACLCE